MVMLSRIARGLYDLGRQVERAQNVARILEVNHKMNLERASVDETNVWTAISESFGCEIDQPTERSLYEELVISDRGEHSVRACIASARSQGRAMRDHISEEMWLHLNRTHLDLTDLSFDAVLRLGRSEFNRRVELFADALFGLADDTMIRDQAWAFLRVGKLAERALMICRILDIKRKSLAPAPELEGAPIDVHQWQALLRSLSGYEPYRRAYDARILPGRVLEFVLKHPHFPRSLLCTLDTLCQTLASVPQSTSVQLELLHEVTRFRDQLRQLDPAELLLSGSLENELHSLERRCTAVTEGLELAYFTSLRVPSAPIAASPGAALVPQQ
jgi:uncharacterized alpha-E superfamily protein